MLVSKQASKTSIYIAHHCRTSDARHMFISAINRDINNQSRHKCENSKQKFLYMLQRFVLATRKQETQSERPKKYDIWLSIERKHYDWQEALLSQRKHATLLISCCVWGPVTSSLAGSSVQLHRCGAEQVHNTEKETICKRIWQGNGQRKIFQVV